MLAGLTVIMEFLHDALNVDPTLIRLQVYSVMGAEWTSVRPLTLRGKNDKRHNKQMNRKPTADDIMQKTHPVEKTDHSCVIE